MCKSLVHVFGQTPHHYVPMHAFLTKIKLISSNKQHFWAWNIEGQKHNSAFHYYNNGNELFKKMKELPENTHFVFHGMFERQIWPYLAFSSLSRRCSWVCWGAELYQHFDSGLSLKRKIMNILHRKAIGRFERVMALMSWDAELIMQRLCNRKVDTLPYPLIGVQQTDENRGKSAKITVLIGNSAAPSNEHNEGLQWLSRFADDPIRIIAPLNYGGPQAYVEEVIANGKRLFGDKFEPITHLLTKEEYDKLLTDVDVTVFSHHRQQGLYVVYSMFKHGKKMFIRRNTSSFDSLTKMGFIVNDSASIPDMSIEQFAAQKQATRDLNSKLMEDTYSESALLPKWQKMMNGILN